MKRTAHRLAAILAATLATGCSPEPATPPSTGLAPADAGLESAPVHRGFGAAIRKKKEPGPAGSPPRAPTVKPNSNL